MARKPLTRSGMLNQFAGSAVSTATGFAVGSVIAPTLAPVTQGLLNETWTALPNRPLSAQIAAELAARGFVAPDAGAAEAKTTGYARRRFDLLRDLASNAPSWGEVRDLWNRGLISEAEAASGLEQAGVRAEWSERLRRARHILIPFTDTIRLAVHEVYGPLRGPLDLDAEYPDELTGKAAAIGLSESDARDMWAGHWELPSREEGAQMLYRGEIDAGRFSDLLRALDFAPTWRKPLEAISRAIPTLSDMIRFAVREVYAPKAERDALGIDLDYPEAFTAQAAMHGLSEEYARAYWAAHWRLPSAQQGYRMLWRGEINEDGLRGLLKALDYPLPWRERLQNIAYLVPGRVDLRRMLAAGIIDRGEVLAGYKRLGYTAKDAETLTQFAEHSASASSSTQTSYIGRARTTLFNRVHTEFTGRQLTRDEAAGGLEAAGVPEAERGPILDLWTAEYGLIRTELTQAQIVKAWKKGQYDRDTAVAELRERGMTDKDANTLLDENA